MVKTNHGQLKNELTEMLRELHLPTVRAEFEEMARQAENQSLSFEQYLVELIRRECEERRVVADALLPDSHCSWSALNQGRLSRSDQEANRECG